MGKNYDADKDSFEEKAKKLLSSAANGLDKAVEQGELTKEWRKDVDNKLGKIMEKLEINE